MRAKVVVTGLNSYVTSLRKLDKEAPKELRAELNEIADVLINRARQDIPKRTGKASKSLKARSTPRAVRIAVGGRIAPYYPWLDFGGQGRKPGRPSHREFIKEGRYLYPNLREMRPQMEIMLMGALVRSAMRSGLEVTNG